jgi:hypothetical protein
MSRHSASECNVANCRLYYDDDLCKVRVFPPPPSASMGFRGVSLFVATFWRRGVKHLHFQAVDFL